MYVASIWADTITPIATALVTVIAASATYFAWQTVRETMAMRREAQESAEAAAKAYEKLITETQAAGMAAYAGAEESISAQKEVAEAQLLNLQRLSDAELADRRKISEAEVAERQRAADAETFDRQIAQLERISDLLHQIAEWRGTRPRTRRGGSTERFPRLGCHRCRSDSRMPSRRGSHLAVATNCSSHTGSTPRTEEWAFRRSPSSATQTRR